MSVWIPGGSTLSKLADNWVAKKRREAAKILMEEVQTGRHGEVRFDEHDLDPMIEIILRFAKAVAEGAARENLRLLAQVIAGLKKNRALDGDQFRRWAAILEQLTRDELIVLGRAFAVRKKIEAAKSPNTFWQDLQVELQNGGYEPSVIRALCASLSRTGILLPLSGFGSITYMDTPWLMELGELADLEALAEETRQV
jgi:hypothetical protein